MLVKPQFEVGRENVGKGGIVRDIAARDAALENTRRGASGRARRPSYDREPDYGYGRECRILLYGCWKGEITRGFIVGCELCGGK